MSQLREKIRLGIIEDDTQVLDYLIKAFSDSQTEKTGFYFEVSATSLLNDTDALIEQDAIDIWIVDLNLPAEVGATPSWRVGQSLVREIHNRCTAAIVVYTSESLGERANELLALGADDFIRKAELTYEQSFKIESMQEYLRSKLISIWRRTKVSRPKFATLSAHSSRKFDIGKWRFEISTRQLNSSTEAVRLTVREHAVLRHLCISNSHTINKSEFLAFVVGQREEGNDVRLKNLIYRLRHKLGPSVSIVGSLDSYILHSVSEQR
jgi:two-component system, OmpR family, response regulator TctD